MKKLCIIGAGGHGKVVLDVALSMQKYYEIVFLDDSYEIKKKHDVNVVDKICNYSKYKNKYEFIVAIGENKLRRKIQNAITLDGGTITRIIHRSVIIGSNVKVGKGSVLFPYSIINPNSTIGEGCIINTAALVEHDCYLGDYVHLSPRSCIAGNVKVGSFSWLGINSTVINGISIAENSILGAGSVLIKNIEHSNCTFAGVPAVKKSDNRG